VGFVTTHAHELQPRYKSTKTENDLLKLKALR
jgi:hypothetical protein